MSSSSIHRTFFRFSEWPWNIATLNRYSPNCQNRYSVKYNPVSLIEAKWFILRKARNRKSEGARNLLQSYRRSLLSLERDKRIQSTQLTNEKIEELSNILLAEFAMQDYFDQLIFSTAANLGSILLTEDSVLHEIFKKMDDDSLKPKKTIKWKDLRNS